MISTGVDGPASLTFSPRSLISARTRPLARPAMMLSPTCSVPFCISTVASGPRALSSFASMITPRPRRFGFARSSIVSACSRIISSSSSTPSPVLAETGHIIVSPPQSSQTMPYFVKSVLTRSGSASGLSILLIATIIGTFAAFAWLMASMVCGMTESSAATTRIAMSVACAPRARIAVKAS